MCKCPGTPHTVLVYFFQKDDQVAWVLGLCEPAGRDVAPVKYQVKVSAYISTSLTTCNVLYIDSHCIHFI